MSVYYPIEFLPETSTTKSNLENAILNNSTKPEPQTRNYLRDNLPYKESGDNQESNDNQQNIDYGKVYTDVTTSLIGGEPTYELTSNSLNTAGNKNKIKERKTRINIDSRLRNVEPKHILDSTLHNLVNPLFFTVNTNKITVYHPNHGFVEEDKIILEYSTSTNVKIKKGLLFEKNSIYVKILHSNYAHQRKDSTWHWCA